VSHIADCALSADIIGTWGTYQRSTSAGSGSSRVSPEGLVASRCMPRIVRMFLPSCCTLNWSSTHHVPSSLLVREASFQRLGQEGPTVLQLLRINLLPRQISSQLTCTQSLCLFCPVSLCSWLASSPHSLGLPLPLMCPAPRGSAGNPALLLWLLSSTWPMLAIKAFTTPSSA